MHKAPLLAVAVAIIALAGGQPAKAYYNGAWCAVFTLAPGGAAERCEYREFESCRQDIVAGNRGFCRQNGYYQGTPAYAPRTRRLR